VTAPELLAALRKVESRGAIKTAHRARRGCASAPPTGWWRYDSGVQPVLQSEILPDWMRFGFPSRRSYAAPDPRSRSFASRRGM